MTSKVLAVAFFASMLMLATGCEQEGPAERAGERIDEAVSEGQNKVEDVVEKAGEELEEAGDKIEKKTQ